jgi:hypothetical protein
MKNKNQIIVSDQLPWSQRGSKKTSENKAEKAGKKRGEKTGKKPTEKKRWKKPDWRIFLGSRQDATLSHLVIIGPLHPPFGRHSTLQAHFPAPTPLPAPTHKPKLSGKKAKKQPGEKLSAKTRMTNAGGKPNGEFFHVFSGKKKTKKKKKKKKMNCITRPGTCLVVPSCPRHVRRGRPRQARSGSGREGWTPT